MGSWPEGSRMRLQAPPCPDYPLDSGQFMSADHRGETEGHCEHISLCVVRG